MRSIRRSTTLLVVAGLAVFIVGCGDDEKTTDLHSKDQLLGALLTVDDVAFIPGLPDDFDADTKWVEAPKSPREGILDPILCNEAGTPSALTLPQAQVELAGINLMEVLLSSSNAGKLFDELVAAYATCGADSSLAYEQLAGAPAAGDESQSYRCKLGLVTIARFGNDLLILRWMVQFDTDLAIPYYPQMVTTVADKITALSGKDARTTVTT